MTGCEYHNDFWSAASSPHGGIVMSEPVSRIAEKGMVAVDHRTRQLEVLARRVAASDVTVMISGESGTGKEVLARFIHRHSTRAAGGFLALPFAAPPADKVVTV